MEEKVTIPVAPPRSLLISMAVRHRHDFWLLDELVQEHILASMRQIHEEVVGVGFYKYEGGK